MGTHKEYMQVTESTNVSTVRRRHAFSTPSSSPRSAVLSRSEVRRIIAEMLG
jgi:hypothetical protein